MSYHDRKKQPLRLEEKYLKLLENRPVEIGYSDLEFPCNDSSKGVQHFNDWSYFKENPVNITSMAKSNIWSKDLLQRINNQQNYEQYVEPAASAPIMKGTRAHKLRMKQSKAALIRWRNSTETASERSAVAGSSRASTRTHSKSPTRHTSPHKNTIKK